MKIRKSHWFGIVLFLLLLVGDLIFFRGEKIFWFLIGIAVVVLVMPFVASVVIQINREREKNERFLEFTRNLAESVKTGTPIGQSIMNMKTKNFGSLTPHIRKLANQISVGIPINRALGTFSSDINSNTIKRAISLIREAETAGGQIDNILDSVAKSIYQIEKLKKERLAAIYNLVVQGYIIFFIFIGIMIVMQFKILPLTAGISITSIEGGGNGFDSGIPGGIGGPGTDPTELARPFLYLLIIQGIFTGFTIGKLTEGNIKSGIKHSFILSVSAFLISTGANAFL